MWLKCKNTYYHPFTFEVLLRVGISYFVKFVNPAKIVNHNMRLKCRITDDKGQSFWLTEGFSVETYFEDTQESRSKKIDEILC